MPSIRSMIGVIAAIALPVTYFEVPRFYSYAQEVAAAPSAETEAPATPEALTEEELQELVAPIALYPDELVALIGAASLYPLQVVEAARFLEKKKSDSSLEPDDDWDASVISLLNYPEVVKMMSDDLDWTQNLGTALAYQQKDVLVAIQQLRDEAVADDVLKSDDKMTVTEENDNVVIESASDTVIYIPQYPPEMLYEPNYAAVPITYYEESYPYYYDYDDAPYFPGFWTGAIWGAVVDWDDWGIWGGDVDGGIDIDCNRCMNDIDINGKVDIGDIDWRNVDRDKISHFDRNQFSSIKSNDIRNNIKAKDANNIRDRARDVKRNEVSKVDRAAKAKDVRARGEGLGGAAAGIAAGGAAAGAAKLAGAKAAGAKPKATAAKAKASAAKAKGTGKATKAKAKAGKPKAGKAKSASRSKKPSSLGEVRGGKSSKVHSSRGKKSMSRGGGSNRSYSRGGGGRSMSRGGGGRSMSRGGGGRGGGGRGGGGRGGGRR